MDLSASDLWVLSLGDVGSLDPLSDLPGTKHLVFGNNDKRKPSAASGLFASCTSVYIHVSDRGAIRLIHDPKHAPNDVLPVLHGHTHASPDDPDPRFVSVSLDKTGWGPISLPEAWRRIEERQPGSR